MDTASPPAPSEVVATTAVVPPHPPQPPHGPNAPDTPNRPHASVVQQLRGPQLVLARSAWATLATLVVAFCLANLPVYVSQLQTVCLHAACAPWQLTPARARALEQLHVAPTGYALIHLLISVFALMVWYAVAALIAWRRSRQWLALLTSLLLLAQGSIQ